MMLGTPSRMRVLVSRLIFTSDVSGTCLTRTMMFMYLSPNEGGYARLPLLASDSCLLTSCGLFRPCCFLYHVEADHGALDLVGSLIDLQDLRVAHHFFDRIFLHIARAAHHLDRVDGYFHQIGRASCRERV